MDTLLLLLLEERGHANVLAYPWNLTSAFLKLIPDREQRREAPRG